MRWVFFPLDERLKLLPSKFSPFVREAIVRLGTHLPFSQVPELIQFFCRVPVSVETVRRITEGAGAVQVRREDEALVDLEVQAPPSPEGPAVQQVSADGAMVPLVQGEWAEVRTVAVGTVEGDGSEPHTREISYFSRLCDAKTFHRLAALPLHRAGTEKAGVVCAVMDGADWLTQFCDLLCPEAVRILDFPHAAEHLSAAAQAVFGPGTAEASEWLGRQLRALKEGDRAVVIEDVEALVAGTAEARRICQREARYLRKRQGQMAYDRYIAAGYPIGSGMVESANKLVVEARLKGSGMHWHRRNVNALLALRTATCSGTWTSTWCSIEERIREAERSRRWRRHPRPVVPLPPPRVRPASLFPPSPPSRYFNDGKPTHHHPWKRDHLPPSGAPRLKNAKS